MTHVMNLWIEAFLQMTLTILAIDWILRIHIRSHKNVTFEINFST